MGTKNFISHAVLPLYVFTNDSIMSFEQYREWVQTEETFCDVLEQYNKILNTAGSSAAEDFLIDAYNDQLWHEWQSFRDVLDEIELELKYESWDCVSHTLSLKDGYYEGIQIYVSDDDPRPEEVTALTDEEWQEFKDWNDMTDFETRELYIDGFVEEENQIKAFCDDLAKKYGMTVLKECATFSDGTAMYQEVKQ